MNTLKIECGKNDYIIRTSPEANSENELIVDIPEDWNCDYVNVVLWEEDICEIFENNDEHIILIPRCGELLLEVIQADNEKQFITIPERYEEQQISIIKVQIFTLEA